MGNIFRLVQVDFVWCAIHRSSPKQITEDACRRASRTLFGELIQACANCHQPDKAFELFEELQKEYYLAPNRRAYTALITACSRTGNVERASAVVQEMEARGVPPRVQDYNALLAVCAAARDGDTAFEALQSMAAARIQPDVRSCEC